MEGNDTIRADSVKEAVPRLTHILTQLDKEIEQVEIQLSQAREKVKEERNSTLGAFEKDLSKPEFQKVCSKRVCLCSLIFYAATIRSASRYYDARRINMDVCQAWRREP